jgi:hypothetical protein
MSAGTVLVMSGDAIHMDYASVLGPIDPQVQRGDQLVPALGHLEQYQRLIDKSGAGTLTTAELVYLVQNFDAAELYRYEQERELSIALLEEWLVNFKFKTALADRDKGDAGRGVGGCEGQGNGRAALGSARLLRSGGRGRMALPSRQRGRRRGGARIVDGAAQALLAEVARGAP